MIHLRQLDCDGFPLDTKRNRCHQADSTWRDRCIREVTDHGEEDTAFTA